MPSSPRACRPTSVSAPADASASRRVEVGDHIRADDILAELDRKDLQTAVDNAQAVLGRSCIRLKRLIIMAFVLMLQLQSVHKLLLVVSVAPLGLIGAVAASRSASWRSSASRRWSASSPAIRSS